MPSHVIATEPYQTADGAQYTLRRVRNRDPRDDEPPEYWTYLDDRGYARTTSFQSERHPTREAAIAHLEEERRIDTLGGSFERGTATPFETREEYEAACRAAGQEPLTDDACDSYGIAYGVFERPQYSAEQIIKARLARRRQIALQAIQARQPPEDLTHSPRYTVKPPTADDFLARFGEDALLECARAIHRANPTQLDDWHFEWLLGHAALHLATPAGIEVPWWADWSVSPYSPVDIDRSPLHDIARRLAAHRIPAAGPSHVYLICRRCHQDGYSGQYPFSTLGGEDLCDDCV